MSIVRQGTLPVGSLDQAITLNVQSSGESHFETVTTTTPYLHRASPQDVASSMKLKKVVGGTIAWNQKIQNGNFTGTTGWKSQSGGSTLSVADGIATITHNGASALSPYNPALGFASGYEPSGVIGHVYYIYMDVKSPITDLVYFGGNQTELLPRYAPVTANTWTEVQVLRKMTRLTTTGTLFSYLGLNGATSFPSGGELKFRNINIFDLTQMFGSTIADYIYSLEQAHAGDGVAWFKALFGEDYYPYNAGELMSVQTSAHKTVGFNQWDEDWETGGINPSTGKNNSTLSPSRIRSKNYIHVVPSTIYCLTIGVKGQACFVCFYDADKNYISGGWRSTGLFTTPTNCYYIRFTTNDEYGGTYNNDICINISSSRNGEYEPYEEHTYPLDGNLTLRGIPKLDSNNELYYDGDTYASDGTVQRKYGIRAYTEGDVTDGSTMITDGTNTVYKLITPTTESADAYTQSQRVGATEEFVDGRTVEIPVGNVSEYKRLIQGDTP